MGYRSCAAVMSLSVPPLCVAANRNHKAIAILARADSQAKAHELPVNRA